MYNNINGYNTKKDSLTKIVHDVDPDIIALCETKKEGQIKEDEFSAYEVIEKNLKQGKEGLLLGARKGSFNSISEVSDTEMKNIMTVKIVYPTFTLRVIIAHAPQETDKAETRLEFFEELSIQVERSQISGDELIILGDFNGRIGCEIDRIVAVDGSPNGKQLCEIINKHGLKVGNFHELCTGRWTRIQSCQKGGIKKSVLDYILTTEVIYDSLEDILIDEEKIYCPYRQKIEKGVQRIVYSDHCVVSCVISIDTGRVAKKSEKSCGWYYSDEGFEKYQFESEMSIQFDLAASSTSQVYSSWVSEFEKLLANCFRRFTFKAKEQKPGCGSGKSRKVRNVIMEMSKKGKIQRSVAKMYQLKLVEKETQQSAEARAERLKAISASLTVGERFSPNGYWKLKRAADKNQRKGPTLTSVLKDNGVEVEGATAIRQAYQDEFEKRLSNREPKPGWEVYTTDTNTVVRRWLEKESHSNPPFSPDELDKALTSLNDDSSPGIDNYPPKLFTKAGSGVVDSILSLCNRIKESKDIPEQWEFVRIVTIYKQKGSKRELKFYRGIFLAIVISKIFEKLVKNRIEDNLRRINLLQAGSRQNRGPPDNVFLFRGTMDHFKFTGKPLYITAYDFEQAFDSLWLEDCILSLKELGVEKEYLQLIYNLNKRAKVTVKTQYGDTVAFETDPIVRQGTVLGPCLCSSSTGEYCGNNPGVCIGNAIISSLVYVDDIIDLSCCEEDFVLSHQNALVFARRKKLTLSGTKCYWMVVNRKARDGSIPELRIDEENLVIPVSEIIYLGDVFNSLGNNDGLITDRIARGTKAMITIMSLMAETEVGTHHVDIMLLLYRSLFLSTMLFINGQI